MNRNADPASPDALSLNESARDELTRRGGEPDSASSPGVALSEEAWRARLPPERYEVLRREGTERPFSSPLYEEHRAGRFLCAGCGEELFTSRMKYDSGTGWPSFFEVPAGRLETRVDRKLFMPRTEYHCARCGGHQGHVFDDPGSPSGKRYCNNGLALRFVPDGEPGR
ncbi:MAG: peptide-methionine (R)-S-oxide reductase MsrB [Magnetococcales bacterium]|nr:peptide-methionine (R)-S-oxide reductase MsrB [Magnetococcales bacterium]